MGIFLEVQMETKNAVISYSMLYVEQGVLKASLMLAYGDGISQPFCHDLWLPPALRSEETKSVAGYFISRVMKIADAFEWDSLRNKAVRVRATDSGVDAIGHIIKDDWFCPRTDFPAFFAAQNAASSATVPDISAREIIERIDSMIAWGSGGMMRWTTIPELFAEAGLSIEPHRGGYSAQVDAWLRNERRVKSCSPSGAKFVSYLLPLGRNPLQ